MDKYDKLKLENQLCFPLYAVSKEIIRKYKPLLDKIDLTYTQYLVMLVLWENKELNVKEIGDKLYLDSGTLTPVLKSLEAKNYISRNRSVNDERNLIISITEEDDALEVPIEVSKCINLDEEDSVKLYSILYKILNSIEK